MRLNIKRAAYYMRTASIAAAGLWLLSVTSVPAAENGGFPGMVTAMDNDPSDTFVEQVIVNGAWLGPASGGGGGSLGGISLPRRWNPGLTATVKWQRCKLSRAGEVLSEEKACYWTEKSVAIHPYTRVSTTWIHILPNNEVLIIPAMVGPGHVDYPGPKMPTKQLFGGE